MNSPFSKIGPLEAVLFDIDGTMCLSDPLHHRAFSELLQQVGYNGGVPITVEFGIKNLAGKSNAQIAQTLFPDWDESKVAEFFEQKEALFARLAAEHLKEVKGLHRLCEWIQDRGVKRAAVTNAPRANAELMISILGLSEFFHAIVSGEESARPKPFPDPYLQALKELNASADRALVFEDSVTGTRAGVAAEVLVIAVAAEGREEALTSAGAAMVIRDYEDMKLWSTLEAVATAHATEAGLNETK